MTSYSVYIKRTVQICVEVEANSPEEAEAIAWDVPEDEIELGDSDSVVDYIIDENNVIYCRVRYGEYEVQA